ncbi:unnamed protein product [Prorocentrum cordatum]|uniref:Uncharacterized protein n=1 Tax=Prorocentrum cordatum TaxID=2364126 RepID=A0ABN9QGJ3_9DINO|nr:unnamed protein product [Polarella glacialis]
MMKGEDLPDLPLAMRRARRVLAPAGAAALPPHAVRLEGPWGRRLLLLPVLHGRLAGPGQSAEEAARAIRALAPRQVLVELCARRYAEAQACAVLGLPPRPPPRLDILGNIDGGLLGHEMAPVLAAAREVGAAVTPVDRPRAATRGRVAHRLWHPRLLQGLLNYGGLSMRLRRGGAPVDSEETWASRAGRSTAPLRTRC